ncbi:MAG: hypothetical protein JW850_06035, partial [Thermoflexales bacterium]|nr:hypothetical protein [Thermoflexales bacterium]
DTFSVPGAPPYWQPPIRAGVVRYEEDDPALRYNGVPFRQTVGTWAMVGVAKASGAYVARSETPSDTISLTFEGRWASIGVRTGTNAGMALVSIDGISYGSIDTYSALEDVTSYIYPGLPAGTHTITLTVLDDHNPGSSNNLFYLDYIDVWDGTEFAPARIEADRVSDSEGRVYFSDGWGHYNLAAASGGVYVEDTVDGANLWFLFTGDSVDYFAISRPTLSLAQVFIDNVDYGLVTATYPFALSPLAFQYTGLGAGSHVLRLHGVTNARVDAFETPTTSFVGMPMVEWYDTAPGGGTDGMVTTPAVGDLDGDGIVEIVASSSGGVLYVYRGDGMDSGSGSPLLWQHVITGSDPDAPALADLDGIPGAEIVVGSNGGLYAFRAGGTLWWHNTAIRPDWGGTAIGNLDGDDLPEIAVAAATGLHVVEPDGQLAWTYNLFNSSPPILADLTGDGALDILTAKNNVLYLFDYEQGVTPTLAWQLSFTTTLEGRGAPAVADIDGLQPGGDAGPEIAVVSNGYIHVVDASGSLLWSYATPSGTPGGVSIADTDGDGEVEIVASVQVANPGYNPGRIYVLNADGSLLWEAMARDSTSANSVSTHDFDGDGDWEIVWNGRDQGLTIYDGNNGAILYNEPAINSMTAKDFPIVADVDGDNHVEIVTGDTEGIYVVGHDAAWAPSRPIWNQYNYHVTNVADDLSVPPIEPDSWTVHNTYRTQTPVLNPAPVYSIDITHTVMSSGMAVLTDTFSLPPDTSAPAYHWHYRQYWYQAPHTIHFDARLLDLQAGEVRQVSHGTDVSYRLFSGANHIAMPPLYVEAARIVAITPSTVALDPGSTARYTVTLYNPAPDVQTYTLSVGGLPGDFAAPGSVLVVPANATLTHTLLITTPAGGELGVYNLAVYIQTGAGGTDTAPASLVLADRLGLSIAPSSRLVVYGGIVTYTLTLTNDDDAARQFGLGVAGLDAAQIALPASLALAAHQAVTVPLVVTACQPQGLYPFRVEASAALADSDLRARAEAVLTVLGEPGVELSLLPPTAVAGQASPAFFTVLVTNTGRLADGYDLSANLPAGWRYEFRANGRSLAHLDLTPYVFNAASLQLVVFPPDGVPAASYPISVTAVSSLNAGVSASDEGLVAVSPRGVTVEIMPHVTTMNPPGSSTWDVLVTNTGEQADTFALVAGGIVSSSAQFDANPVSLEAGQLTVVHMSASALDFALPETYPLAVTAYSHGDPDVWGCDTASLSFLGYEGVALSVTPALIVFTDTLEATYLLLVTNTANTGTTFALDASADPALGLALEVDVLYIPPHMTAGILLTARANMPGTYRITVSAASTTSAARDEGTATLVVVPGDELPATITGTVFEDANGNRTRDQGEAGLGGVQVSLDHAVTTTTNVSGTYVLSTTQPGRHTLIQTDLPGYTSTTANSVAITVALGGNYRVDFGDKLVEAVTCTIDTHEPDDSPAAAHSLGIGVTATLNFCDDAVDWLSFTAQAGQVYTITTWAWGARTDTILTLYDSDGSTQLAKNDNYAPAPDLSSRIVWQAAVDGACFVRVTNRDDSSGDQTDYDVRIDTAAAAPPAGLLYLPVVVKTTIPSLYLPVVLKEADSLAAP